MTEIATLMSIQDFLDGDSSIKKVDPAESRDVSADSSESSRILESMKSSETSEILDKCAKNIREKRRKVIKLQGLEPSTEYRVEQYGHEFPFGISIRPDMLLSPQDKETLIKIYGSDEHEFGAQIVELCQIPLEYSEAYLNTLLGHSNALELEMLFSWRAPQEFTSLLQQRTKEFLQSRQEIQDVHGNFIFWNNTDQLPLHLRRMAGQDEKEWKDAVFEAMVSERLKLIQDFPEVTRWNLINEPLARSGSEVIFDPVDDIEYFAKFINRARALNPDAQLGINEYTILNGYKVGEYAAFVKGLREHGADVDFIGIQGHVFNEFAPTLATSNASLDVLASLNTPIVITEFDVSDELFKGDVSARAEYIKQMLTLFYGKFSANGDPLISAIYTFGLEDSTHWRGSEGAGYFNSDWSLNEAGEAYFGKIENEWKTVITGNTNAEGVLEFDGFPGDYKAIPSSIIS